MKVIKESKTHIDALPGRNGNAFSSSRRLYESIKKCEDKIIESSMTEAVDWEVPENERGGMIIFSEEVNALPQSDNKLINWLKQKLMTFTNTATYKKKIDTIADSHDLVGWTVGKFLDGRYKAKNGKMYGEKSLSVEIVGVDSDKLVDIATELARTFEQEAVMLKDYNNGKILFVNQD